MRDSASRTPNVAAEGQQSAGVVAVVVAEDDIGDVGEVDAQLAGELTP